MKFYRYFFNHSKKVYRKFLLIMKISMLISIVFVWNVSAGVFAQVVHFDKTGKSTSIKEVLKVIEKQTEYTFFYNDAFLDLTRPITIHQQDIEVGKLLDIVFKDTDLTYLEHEHKFIVITPKAVAQGITVTGTVTENGEPIPGVNIIIKGTTTGMVTDINGKYSITVPEKGTVLIFSFVGYTTQEFEVGDMHVIDVHMAEDTHQLEEVVVVGFGTQKKVNLTGAVGTVDVKALESRPVQNATQALQGLVAGLNITQTEGDMGTTPNINIRGITTIGEGSSGQPLVLIDGMEGDLNTVNSQDIEHISVLKDAAASSIYGSRAPFGVILITTKNGKTGRATINYNNNFRLNYPINMPQMADSYKFAIYWNDSFTNSGSSVFFDQEQMQRILAYQNGTLKESVPVSSSNPNQWADYEKANGNVDWYDVIYKKRTFAQEHNISVNGGKEGFTYYISGNYLGKEGFMAIGGDDYSRYLLTGKINARLNDYFSVNYTGRFIRENYEKPTFMNENLFYSLANLGWPIFPVYDPNGHMYNATYSNAIRLNDGGRTNTQTDQLYQQVQVLIEPLKGWKIFGEGNFRMKDWFNSANQLPLYDHDVAGNPYVTITNSSVTEQAARQNYYNTNIWTEYNRDFGGHHAKVLLGFQSELTKTHQIMANRSGIVIPSLTSLNTTSGIDPETGKEINAKVSGYNDDWSVVGFFGRINYDYQGRYLLEGNLRYDGSSRFRGNERWKWFPSVSVGWNIAREAFWESLDNKINTLKFRASYGSLGNQNTDMLYPTYVTMDVTAANGSWLSKGSRPNTANAPGLVSSSLTWERVSTWNVGADLGFFNNRLTSSFDYFVRKTIDMVGPAPELPATLGTDVPTTNNTDLKTYGFEWEVSWNDYLKNGLRYNIRFLLSDSQTEITRYPNETGSLKTYYAGQKYGELWGYVTAGIARTQEEIDTHLATMPNGAQASFGTDWKAGDIMYADLDGDGKIDAGASTLEKPGDRKVIGNSQARFMFGLDLNMDWKGFDFRAFFQGIMKRDYINESYYFWGSRRNYQESTCLVQHLDYFRDDPDHPLGLNLDAYYARPVFNVKKNIQVQTRYLLNAAYIRLKNVQLGYSLPPSLTQKIAIQKLRFFVSGENLWTGTKLTKIFDPEQVSGGDNRYSEGNVYPLTKVFSFGLSVTF